MTRRSCNSSLQDRNCFSFALDLQVLIHYQNATDSSDLSESVSLITFLLLLACVLFFIAGGSKK